MQYFRNHYLSYFFLLTLGMIFCLFSASVWANPVVYKKEVKVPFEEAYKKVYASLEKHRFYVIFEAYISKNMARFKNKWGAEYNKNKLDTIRSLAVCNVYYVNQVANHDPDMLSLCPLRVVIVEKKPMTRILFVRPSSISKNSPANSIILEVETTIVKAIEAAFK